MEIADYRAPPTSSSTSARQPAGVFDFPGWGSNTGVESIGSVQHIAISTDATQLERIKARLAEKGIQYLGPDRGVTNVDLFQGPGWHPRLR